MAETSYTQQSIWNIDDERLKQLNYYMVLCEECFVDWDLENIYTYLHAIKRTASAKLQKYEKDWGKLDNKKNYPEESVKGKFNKLEKVRRNMNLSNDKTFESNRIEFYNVAVEVFEFLSAKLQQHGFFFREGLDPSKAAMRR